jgi:ferredoxin
MSKVTFTTGETAELEDGYTLLDAAMRCGAPVRTTCGGRASCTHCKVKIIAGGENLSPIDAPEKAVIGNVYFITKERLACQAKVSGDVTAQPMPIPDEIAKKKKAGPMPPIKKIYKPGGR